MKDNQVIGYIQLGIEKGLIKILDDGKRIEYIEQKNSRSYAETEEQVQVEASQILSDSKFEVECMII